MNRNQARAMEQVGIPLYRQHSLSERSLFEYAWTAWNTFVKKMAPRLMSKSYVTDEEAEKYLAARGMTRETVEDCWNGAVNRLSSAHATNFLPVETKGSYYLFTAEQVNPLLVAFEMYLVSEERKQHET